MSWFLGLQRHKEALQFISLLYMWEAFSLCSLPLPLQWGTWHRDGKARPKCTNNSMSQGPKSVTEIHIQLLITFWEPSAIWKQHFWFFFSFPKRSNSELAIIGNSTMHAGHCLLTPNKLYNPGPWHFNHINDSTKPLLRDLERYSGGNP